MNPANLTKLADSSFMQKNSVSENESSESSVQKSGSKIQHLDTNADDKSEPYPNDNSKSTGSESPVKSKR